MKGIYKITSPSGKVYVGQSRNIKKRFRDYKYYKGCGQNRLFTSFSKYGVENHLFEVLEECELNLLNIKERYWQEHFNVLSDSGLNCLYVNTDTCPTILSETTLLNMRKAQQNRKPMSDEQKQKISASWTLERKANQTLKTKGRFVSEKTKANMRKPKINIDLNELKSRTAKPVLQFSLDGLFIKEWISASEISRELGIKFQLISACCTGKIKKSKGFIWKFKNYDKT